MGAGVALRGGPFIRHESGPQRDTHAGVQAHVSSGLVPMMPMSVGALLVIVKAWLADAGVQNRYKPAFGDVAFSFAFSGSFGLRLYCRVAQWMARVSCLG